jgi:ribosomal protein L37E
LSAEEIRQALTNKGIDSDCRRCGKDVWHLGSRAAIVPDLADNIEMAGGTAASVRVCAFCGFIELYNPGTLNTPDALGS